MHAGAPRNPICDLSDPRYDICEISGDARAIGVNRTILYVPPAEERDTDGSEWAIKDQSRKKLVDIIEVKVKTLSTTESLVAPDCTSQHAVPAVVFAMNGLTSNPWHDFSDVLIPLFITTRAYDGEVQFLVTEIQSWFVDKYRLRVSQIRGYPGCRPISHRLDWWAALYSLMESRIVDDPVCWKETSGVLTSPPRNRWRTWHVCP